MTFLNFRLQLFTKETMTIRFVYFLYSICFIILSVYSFHLFFCLFFPQALCNSLDKYLETFRSAVIVERDETICELLVRTTPLINQVRVLAKLLSVHPSGE